MPNQSWFFIFLLARLSYVGYVWFVLTRPKRDIFSYARFKKIAAFLIYIDAVVFAVAVFQLRNEFNVSIPILFQAIGVLLMVFGVLIKYSAFKTLGKDGYYWKNFFTDQVPLKLEGVYKYLKNPMYGLGYLHAYGWAIFNLSLSGLVMAFFAQAVIMIFCYRVERPYFVRIYKKIDRNLSGDYTDLS